MEYLSTRIEQNTLKGFFGTNSFLSNFYECEVHYNGLVYSSSEAAYQAQKTDDEEIRKRFTALTAIESKRAGRKLKIVQDWEQTKVKIMYEIVKDKFTRNKELGQKLIDTHNLNLEETNWWWDTFWGVCNGEGKNYLGKILMKVRNEIK